MTNIKETQARAARRAQADPRIMAINRHYDRGMFSLSARRRYGGSDFHNYGYWEQATRTPREASENLMEKLLAFIPNKHGTILDVACGKGATTRHLLNYYAPKDVTGINISAKQLRRCRLNAPGVNFRLMSATAMTFPAESFNNIICVEAALHFNTRETFLREVWRVLKPGGRLVLSDVLRRHRRPRNPLGILENYIGGLNQYRQLYLRAGFEQIKIIDATTECWVRFHQHALWFLRQRFYRGELDRMTFKRRWRACVSKTKRTQFTPYYVLVSARKPGLQSRKLLS